MAAPSLAVNERIDARMAWGTYTYLYLFYLFYLCIIGSTNANNSLFSYDEGKSHASYFDIRYVPIFLDEEDLVFHNTSLGQQARDLCGDNKQCLFDIHTTGKISIGKASKQAVESFIAVINETETPGKQIPSLKGYLEL